MKRAIACLWRGVGLPEFSNDVYDRRYVEALATGIERHVPDGQLTLISDEHYHPLVRDIEGVEHVKFHGIDFGGWSRMMETMRPDLWPKGDERIVGMNLDIVLVGDCSWLWEWDEADVGLPTDPLHPSVPANPVWTWNRAGAKLCWEAYRRILMDRVPTEKVRMPTAMGQPSEMALFRQLAAEHGWPRLERAFARLRSYKKHVLPARSWKDASVVYFHGSPKPHELPETHPLKKVWNQR